MKYTPYTPTETISNWLEKFAEFAKSQRQEFDAYTLTKSEEWKKLIQTTLVKRKEKVTSFQEYQSSVLSSYTIS